MPMNAGVASWPTRSSQRARLKATTHENDNHGGRGGNGVFRDALPGLSEHEVGGVADEDRAERADQERRIGRATIELRAGQYLVDQPKYRRVPAEGVDDGDREGGREKADLAIEQLALPEGDEDQQDRGSTNINLPHVLGDEETCLGPGEAWRAPVVFHAVGGTEHLRQQERQEQCGVHAAAAGTLKIDRRAVAFGSKQAGQQDRYSDQEQRQQAAGHQRSSARLEHGATVVGRPPAPEDVGDEQIGDEQRYLIAAKDDERADQPRQQPPTIGAEADGAVDGEHGDRPVGEREHLADVLEPPGHRRAEREDEAAQDGTGPMPLPVAHPSHQGDGACELCQQDRDVDDPQARTAIDQR